MDHANLEKDDSLSSVEFEHVKAFYFDFTFGESSS